jgi:hypothetical protein
LGWAVISSIISFVTFSLFAICLLVRNLLLR